VLRTSIPPPTSPAREWAALIARKTPLFIGSFRKHPAEFDHSEGVFRMTVLAQVLKQDLGVHFNPEVLSRFWLGQEVPDANLASQAAENL
jgi:hypothetical protein